MDTVDRPNDRVTKELDALQCGYDVIDLRKTSIINLMLNDDNHIKDTERIAIDRFPKMKLKLK